MCHKRDSLWAHCFPSFCRWIRIKYILIWLMQYTAENFNKFEFTIGLNNDAKRCICDEWCNFLTLSWRQNHLRDKKPVFIELAHMFREREKKNTFYTWKTNVSRLFKQPVLFDIIRTRERKMKMATMYRAFLWYLTCLLDIFSIFSDILLDISIQIRLNTVEELITKPGFKHFGAEIYWNYWIQQRRSM